MCLLHSLCTVTASRFCVFCGCLEMTNEHKRRKPAGGKSCCNIRHVQNKKHKYWLSWQLLWRGSVRPTWRLAVLSGSTKSLYWSTGWHRHFLKITWICRMKLPVPVAARSKARFCGRSPAGIEGSNPGGGHGVLSVVSAVCCRVAVSTTSWSLIQRSPTGCVASFCVCMCEIFECYCTLYGTVVCVFVLQLFALRPSSFVMLQSVCYYYRLCFIVWHVMFPILCV